VDRIVQKDLDHAKDASSRERGVQRILKLFAFLNELGRPVRVADLPKALSAPRSTIYELVRVLTEAGLLEVNGEENKVFFGRLMYLYGTNYVRQNDLMSRGAAEVDRLSRETGETSELCILYRNKQAIVHMSPGSRPMRISSAVGSQIPIPWTASGRVLLANCSAEEIAGRILPEDLRLPDGRSMSLQEFIEACHQAKGRDIVLTRGLINSFTQCFAAPITGLSGYPEATICFVVPLDIPDEKVNTLKKTLIASSKKLSFDICPGREK
jgi:DNA-binding IclR family transcriptional regulator